MARLLDALMHPISQLMLLISIVALSGLYLVLSISVPARPTPAPITPFADGMLMPAEATSVVETPTATVASGATVNANAPRATSRPLSAIPTMANGPFCACSRDTYSCAELGERAQGCFDYCLAQGQGDVHRLDYNGNGVACEE